MCVTHVLYRRSPQIMEDVPGWEVGKNVYKTVNYMPPMLQYHPIRRLSTHH